jgi:hypothetical protein
VSHRQELRDVVAAEWKDHDGNAVRGQIVSRTKSSARVEWESGRTELVHFDDPKLTFFTADDALA